MKKRLSALLSALLLLLCAASASADAQLIGENEHFRFSVAIDGNFDAFRTDTDQDYTSGGVMEIDCLCGAAHTEADLSAIYSITPHEDCPYTLSIRRGATTIPELSGNESGFTRFQDAFLITCTVPQSLPVPEGEYPFTLAVSASCAKSGQSFSASCEVPLRITEGETDSYLSFGDSLDDILRNLRYQPDVVYRLYSQGKVVWFIQTALTDLNYYSGSLTGNYGPGTAAAVADFQADEGLPSTGESDAQTMIRLFRRYLGDAEITYGPGYETPHWTDDQPRFDSLGLIAGTDARLIDLWTDIAMNVRLSALGRHIDAEPLCAADTRALLRIYAKTSADQLESDVRPMLLVIGRQGGDIQIICTMDPRPKDAGEIADNDFDGRLCLYLLGSTDHHQGDPGQKSWHDLRLSDAANLMERKKGRTVGVGAIISGQDTFESMPPVETPTLVLPGGQTSDASTLLKYDTSEKTNGTITYNVHLSALDGNEIDLLTESTLCFPYPEGLDQNSARKYRIIIHHQISEKVSETFKSEDGEIVFAPQGLCIRIKSFSPFALSWQPAAASALPQTGDPSVLPAWLALLGASGLGFSLLRKKRRA